MDRNEQRKLDAYKTTIYMAIGTGLVLFWYGLYELAKYVGDYFAGGW